MGLTRTRSGLHLWWRVPWEVAKRSGTGYSGVDILTLSKRFVSRYFRWGLGKRNGFKGSQFNWGNSNAVDLQRSRHKKTLGMFCLVE